MKASVWGATRTVAKPKGPMKTKLTTKSSFQNDLVTWAQRTHFAGLAVTISLLGFLLTAIGQDPWWTVPNRPLDTNVSAGVSVTLQVNANTAYPPLSYQWQHEGTNLPSATNSILQITNVTVAHAGGYVAWASNVIGGFTNSRTALLTIDPTFTQVAGGDLTTDTVGAWNACWIDYDGDGLLDVSVAPGGNISAVTPLYHNEGNGTFRKITTNAIALTYVRTFAHVWADYDNDGKVDLFVPNFSGVNDILFHNNGGGSFTRITTGHPVIDGLDSGTGAWADYDRDGVLDLFVGTYGGCPGQNDLFYRNNGDVPFRKMTAAEVGLIVGDSAPTDIAAWADVDNDGWPELSRCVGNGCLSSWWNYTTNQLLHLDGQGKFSLMDIGEMKRNTGGYTAITWADYDNDGFLDALVWAEKGLVGLYRNLAGQGFTNVAAIAFSSQLTNCYAIWAGDYDNNGWQDIVANFVSGTRPAAFLRNNGDGTFTSRNLGSPTSAMGWHVPGDYNNDGFLDILMPYGPNLRHSLFRNNGNTNHWLKVKLDGRASNRDGIGAKVRVNATIVGTNFWQMREISGQGEVQMDNGLLAHFGLGDATNVTTLRIEWPSGIVQEIPNVAANQFLTVVESQGYGTAPVFTGATKNANGVQLTFTEPDAPARYILEGSTNLVNWTKLLARTSAGVTTNYTDWRATNYAHCFYRLQVP